MNSNNRVGRPLPQAAHSMPTHHSCLWVVSPWIRAVSHAGIFLKECETRWDVSIKIRDLVALVCEVLQREVTLLSSL